MTHLELTILNYLLNALWQIPLLYLVAAIAARLARPAGPHIEHRIWVAALFLETILPACTFGPSLRGILLSLTHSGPATVTTQTTILDAVALPRHSNLAAIVATVVLLAYGAALLFVTGRLLYRLHRTRALRRDVQPITLVGDPLTIWRRCARAFSVHDAQLAASTAVAGPSTIGIRHRIVLLSPALLTDLPSEDLAAALAHEFAHMRRRDFARNLFYEILSLPVAWHPLLWLTRLRIAETREMVCDELAAEATHGVTRYAHSLLRLAQSFSRPAPAATLHAIGIFDANVLERRVMTLNRKRTLATSSRRIAIAAAVLLGAATCASAMSLRLEVPASAVLFARSAAPLHAIIASHAQQTADTIHVKGGVAAGQLISKVQPVYPPIARAAHVGGIVLLHAIIGKDGTVKQLAVVSGPPMLAGAAMDAVRQWVYKPYLLNGEPVEVDTTITVNFSPKDANGQETSSQTSEAANVDHGGFFTIGGSVHPPVAIYSPDPQYTEAARKAKLSGSVIVSLIVDSSGQPQNVRVARGLGNELDEKAVEAVQQYRFKPGTKDGEPVAVALNVEVDFQIF